MTNKKTLRDRMSLGLQRVNMWLYDRKARVAQKTTVKRLKTKLKELGVSKEAIKTIDTLANNEPMGELAQQLSLLISGTDETYKSGQKGEPDKDKDKIDLESVIILLKTVERQIKMNEMIKANTPKVGLEAQTGAFSRVHVEDKMDDPIKVTDGQYGSSRPLHEKCFIDKINNMCQDGSVDILAVDDAIPVSKKDSIKFQKRGKEAMAGSFERKEYAEGNK